MQVGHFVVAGVGLPCSGDAQRPRARPFSGARTFAEEWGLTCAEEYKLAALDSFYFAGFFVGACSAGRLADARGRSFAMAFS